jgi:hypothetical protein
MIGVTAAKWASDGLHHLYNTAIDGSREGNEKNGITRQDANTTTTPE